MQEWEQEGKEMTYDQTAECINRIRQAQKDAESKGLTREVRVYRICVKIIQEVCGRKNRHIGVIRK